MTRVRLPYKQKWLVGAALLLLAGAAWLLISSLRGPNRAFYDRALKEYRERSFTAATWFLIDYLRDPTGTLYDRALKEYREGNFTAAIEALEEARAKDPKSVRVNVLLGWSYWRSGQSRRAESFFARALALDRSVDDAKLGLAYASLSRGETSVALPLLQELAAKYPDDKERHLALGEAYVKSGDILAGAKTFSGILDRDPSDADARREFLALYGYADYRPELPLFYTAPRRPESLQIFFRTSGEYFQTRIGGQWRTIYPVGVNLGPARPGEFPATSSREFSTYFEWLQQIAHMNANVVRAYTVLPPAFYQALKAYNEEARDPLWLIQEVWLDENVQNLFDPTTEQEFQREIVNVIDMLHGAALIQFRRGHNYGIYTADVSRFVLALAIGREVEPRVAVGTNRANPGNTSYTGRYVSLAHGNPTEAWFASMCDFAGRYEMERYNAQRPLTVVNWPPLDPLTHPTEADYAEEQAIRRRLGEAFDKKLPEIPNDMDLVSLDIVRFRPQRDFQAGLFALYHVYQHWPDFLLHEPSYELAQNERGPNRYLGYLRQLKSVHRNFPLFIGEYGLSTSLAAAHLHPQGWNNGGLTEQQQAELLVRFTKNIMETRCAGGAVFEWQDEWFKHVHDYNTADFELPWDRNPLWMNALDPEKNFGVIGYGPAFTVPQLRGEISDWQSASQLYSAKGQMLEGELRAVYAMSDYAYLYLRLDVGPGAIDWKQRNYWVALNTLPGESGSRMLPDINVRLESGANFLVQLSGRSGSRILITENYDPNARVQLAGRIGEARRFRKRGMHVQLEDSIPFQDFVVETNQPRFARDGRYFPPLDYNRSPLLYASADRSSPQFSSHAQWYADPRQGTIELRIPWGQLLITDPSNLEAFLGTDEEEYVGVPGQWLPKAKRTRGIAVVVLALRRTETPEGTGLTVTSALPPVSGGKVEEAPAIYTWQAWDRVEVRPYFKLSYYALQKLFGELRSLPQFYSPPRAR